MCQIQEVLDNNRQEVSLLQEVNQVMLTLLLRLDIILVLRCLLRMILVLVPDLMAVLIE